MMKVLITGSTGFLGSWFVRVAVEKGYKVVATDVPCANFSENKKLGCEVIPLDLITEDTDVLFKGGVDAVIHNAGVFHLNASPVLLRAVNVEGTRKICESALKAGVKRFIMVSTVGVYGKPKRTPCREEDPKNPRNAYELTKWEGELVAVRYYEKRGLPVTVIRPTLIYGEGSKYGHAMMMAGVASLYMRGIRKIHIRLRGGPFFHSVHAEDVARAGVYFLERDETGRVFNVADRTPVRMETFIEAMLEPYGIEVGGITLRFSKTLWKLIIKICKMVMNSMEGRIREITTRDWKRFAREFHFKPVFTPQLDMGWLEYVDGNHVYDISKLLSTNFEFKHPSFVDGIKETMRWYMEQRWLPPAEKPIFVGSGYKEGSKA